MIIQAIQQTDAEFLKKAEDLMDTQCKEVAIRLNRKNNNRAYQQIRAHLQRNGRFTSIQDNSTECLKKERNIQHFTDGKNIAQSYTVMRVVMAYNWHPEKDLPQSSLRIAALKRKSLSKLIMYQQIIFKTGRREIRINVLRNI